jgi:hypothetical protein
MTIIFAHFVYMKLFIFIENDGVTFHPLIFNFGILDLHFLVTIWIIFLYNVAVSGLFIVNPNGMQYVYSLFLNKKEQDSSFSYFIFLMFEIYSKVAICSHWAVDGLLIFSVCVSIKFWLQTFR